MDTLNLVEIFEKTIKKKVEKKCEHGKEKYRCIDCGGSQICEHKKIKYRCVDCGGSSICEHGKRKSRCKECGGNEICEHERRKSSCKECGGSSICEHGRERYVCKDCGGGSICEHGKIKSRCVECGGGSVCKHKRQKSVCKECGGSQICEHKKLKSSCKECGGSAYCEHGKQKSRCIECGGSSICEHGKRKIRCVECNGSEICVHKKIKYYCKECDGRQLCRTELCETFGNKKYEGYCLFCFVNTFPDKPVTRNYKTKEKAVSEKILESFPNFTWVLDKKVEDGCSRRRPDFLLDMGSHIIIIEVDENQHTDYDCSCENKRLMEISQDLQHRSIVFIRFNPDSYIKLDGTKIESCWKINKSGTMLINKKYENEWNERIKILIDQINYWIYNPSEKTIETLHLFYS